MTTPYQCPTPCDEDCEVNGWGCHERHAYDKDHDPEACEALTLAGNLSWLLAAGLDVQVTPCGGAGRCRGDTAGRFSVRAAKPDPAADLGVPGGIESHGHASPGEALAFARDWCERNGDHAVTTPYDSLPAEVRRENWGWFGEPWWSFVCYDEDGKLIGEMRKAFPAGESCLWCDEPFDEAAGDSGQAMPCMTTEGASLRHVHKECAFMNVTGPLAHHEGRCRCHGGSTETPGMTYRQEALEVWRRHHSGTLFR